MINYLALLKEFKLTDYYPRIVSAETIQALDNLTSFLIGKELDYRIPDPLVSMPCPECGHRVREIKQVRQTTCPECRLTFVVK